MVGLVMLPLDVEEDERLAAVDDAGADTTAAADAEGMETGCKLSTEGWGLGLLVGAGADVGAV